MYRTFSQLKYPGSGIVYAVLKRFGFYEKAVDKINCTRYYVENKSHAIYIQGGQMDDKYAALRLQNQLCFPLYAVSNMITRKYKPLLDKLDLTYTQYIVMMVLWEERQVNEKFLCDALCLKSNTVTPLLKKLEAKGFIEKTKDTSDERSLVITLSDAGEKLQDKALCVPETIAQEFHLTQEEARSLYQVLYKMLGEERSRNRQ